MTDRTLQNFVNGEFHDAGDGRASDRSQYRRGLRARASIRHQDVDAAMQAAAMAGGTPPRPKRGLALIRLADAIEQRADGSRGRDPQQRPAPVAPRPGQQEIPARGEQVRFFAGAARVLEGRSAGEYLKDHASSGASRCASAPRSPRGITR